MSLRSMVGRINALLDHDLSPMPLLTVCVGFWLPLQWMLVRNWFIYGIALNEKIHVIASSVLIYFALTALLMAMVVYLGAIVHCVIRVPYHRVVCFGMNLIANILTLLITAQALKNVLFGLPTAPVWVKISIIVSVIIGGLWLSIRGIAITQHLILPRWLALFALVLSFVLVPLEAIQQFGVVNRVNSKIQYQFNGSRPPDIILITLDALSSRHLSCYGYARPTSPNLDAFAQNAVLFERFYANANWTRPGIASILNGSRPWTHAGDLGRPIRSVREAHNLLGALAWNGYEVRTVSTNFFADHFWQGSPVYCADRVLVHNAFSQWAFPRYLPSTGIACSVGPMQIVQMVLELLVPSLPQDRYRLPIEQSEKVLERAPTDRPTFFWLHIIPPHDPYVVSEPHLGHFEPSPKCRSKRKSFADWGFLASKDPQRQGILAGRYDESILAVDEAVGQLMAWLKAHGRFEHSIVVVSTDHGESFSHGYGAHAGPLLTEDLIRVPCLIKRPGQRAPERVSQLFEQADMAPTILHMAGLPVPVGMEGQPYPLKPEGVPVFAMNRDLLTRKDTFSVAMRQGDWKYVAHFGPWVHPWPQRELYDLARDPDEALNLADRKPDIAEPMHQRIVAELAKRGLKPEAP